MGLNWSLYDLALVIFTFDVSSKLFGKDDILKYKSQIPLKLKQYQSPEGFI